MSGCKTCKWAVDNYGGDFSCEFPLPVWLKDAVIRMEKRRNADVIRLNNREVNEGSYDHGFAKCPTWESAA